MAGNPEPVIDLEEDDEEEEEEGMNIKREVDAESASESGVPLGKPEGSADKEPKKVADPKDDQPGGQGSLRKTSPDVRAADVTAEDGEQKSASREPEGAQRKDSDCACVCCWSSASGKHKNEIISSRTRTRRTPHEIQLKTASARAAKKLEATDLLACDKCDFKTSKQGVMARHIKAHAGYVPCACNFCDFKCRGIRVLDKHVIENHLDEMNLKKGKNKRNARRGKKGVEVLPSSLVPYRTIPHLYDPIAIRHRKKKVKNIDKSGDPHPATVEKAPPSSEVGSHCSGSTEPAHSTNGLEETPTLHTENTAAQDRLTCNTNVAATKNPASLDSKERHCVFCSFVCGGVVELEEHVKIHTSSAARPENGFKPKATDLPRSNHSPQVNSGVDLPPKNKVNPSGKRFKLDDLLKEKLSAILTAAAQSTAVTSEKEMSEHAETSAESQPSKSNARTKKSAETPAKKLFSCEICDYETHTRPQFGRHMKTHSGKKTYSCDFCDFKGKGIQGLKKHMMVHTPSVVIRIPVN